MIVASEGCGGKEVTPKAFRHLLAEHEILAAFS
jgi:hypothetical protein